jgi:hypothetical protein
MDASDSAVARPRHGFVGQLLGGRVRWDEIAVLPGRLAPSVDAAGSTGVPAIVPASLAVARRCVEHGTELVGRRGGDGRLLRDHEELRRLAADNAAELFAIEAGAIAIATELEQSAISTRWLEEITAASLAVGGCARVAERAWALRAAASDQPAGALERALRDAATLRHTGGLDVIAECSAVSEVLLALYDPGRPLPPATDPLGERIADPRLSRRNAAHLDVIGAEVERLGHHCRELRYIHDAAELQRRERALTGVGRVARELFAMCAVLARAASASPATRATSQALADVYCAAARCRVRAAALELIGEPDPGLSHSVAACLGDPLH